MSLFGKYLRTRSRRPASPESPAPHGVAIPRQIVRRLREQALELGKPQRSFRGRQGAGVCVHEVIHTQTINPYLSTQCKPCGCHMTEGFQVIVND